MIYYNIYIFNKNIASFGEWFVGCYNGAKEDYGESLFYERGDAGRVGESL